MFWIILIIKVCHSKASIFSLLIVQFPLVRFAHFFIIAKYIFCIFENDTDILWELFFLPGYLTGTVIVYIQMENTWIWGFSCWQEKAVMCYMILVYFFNEFLLTMNLIKKTHTNVDLTFYRSSISCCSWELYWKSVYDIFLRHIFITVQSLTVYAHLVQRILTSFKCNKTASIQSFAFFSIHPHNETIKWDLLREN